MRPGACEAREKVLELRQLHLKLAFEAARPGGEDVEDELTPIEHLDAQAGTWQFSADAGQTWRAIRTDLINRPGNLGLALDRDARLRVLPFGGHRVTGARVAFHTVQRSHGQGNGSYRAYASEDRDGGSRSVTLVLSLAAINGAPPAVHVPRPRNKRAMVQRAAAAAATAAAGSALSGAMAMA